MSTHFEKNIDQNNKSWYLFDAKDQTLGRLASTIARILSGKHKATYTPHVDAGDFVVVVNADKVALTGNKWSGKLYYDHSGFVSGLKIRTATEVRERHPEELIRRAVKGMLSRGTLGRSLNTKLKVYVGEEHPHKAQNPKVWNEPVRSVRRKQSQPKKSVKG